MNVRMHDYVIDVHIYMTRDCEELLVDLRLSAAIAMYSLYLSSSVSERERRRERERDYLSRRVSKCLCML